MDAATASPHSSAPAARGFSLTCTSVPQLSLAKACAHGGQLGLDAKASGGMVRQLFQTSRAISKQQVFSVQKGLSDTMR